MSLFPFLTDSIENDNNSSSNNNGVAREYQIDLKTSTLSGRILEGKDALKVWIEKALKTPRYIHDIYTWDYGHDLWSLIGQGYEKGFIDSEVERRIKDNLSINPKILDCHSFDISLNGDELIVNFTVETVYGEVEINV